MSDRTCTAPQCFSCAFERGEISEESIGNMVMRSLAMARQLGHNDLGQSLDVYGHPAPGSNVAFVRDLLTLSVDEIVDGWNLDEVLSRVTALMNAVRVAS